MTNKYKSFDDWFWEYENYNTRGDRFYENFKGMTENEAFSWLAAAWNCARETEDDTKCPYCSDPALGEVMFNMNCPGCNDRMNQHADRFRKK